MKLPAVTDRRSAWAVHPHVWLFLAALSGSFVWFVWKKVAVETPPLSLSLGIAVAGFLLLGTRFWPALLAGALLGTAMIEPLRPILQSFAHAGGQTLGGIVTAAIIRRKHIIADALLDPSAIAWILVAVLAGTLVGAGVATVAAVAAGAHGTFETGFVERFARFGLGLILATPLVLSWARPPERRWNTTEWLQFGGLMLACAGAGLVIDFAPSPMALSWVVFPLLTLAALRFGLRGATTSVVIVAFETLLGASLHVGPLSLVPQDSISTLQIFVASTAAVMLLLATISDRSREIALRVRAEQRYQAIFDQAGVGVSVISLDGRYLEINDRALEILGYHRDEIVGQPLNRVILGLGTEEMYEPLERLARGVVPFLARELKVRTRNGDARWVRATSKLVRDLDGKPEHIVSVSEDISEKVNAELALADSENRLRLAQELAGVGVWEVDLTTATSRLSLRSAALLGVPWHNGAYRLRELAPVLGKPQLAALRQQLIATAGDKMPFDMSLAIESADGKTRWVRLLGSHDPSDGRNRLLGLTVDITRDVESSAELHEAHERLLRVARLTAVGAMASTLTHELNQPLTAAANFIEAASAGIKADSARGNMPNAMLVSAREQVLRAGRIVYKMRAFTLSGEVMAEPVAAAQMMLGVCASVRRLSVAEGVRIECLPPPAEVTIMGDPVQLEQVLANLVKNATEATRGCAERRVMVVSDVDAHEVRIRVCDTGIGLSEAMLEQPFELFRSSKDHGMGLGLPICYMIVDAHGGRLSAENTSGGGAMFSLVLPRSDQATE